MQSSKFDNFSTISLLISFNGGWHQNLTVNLGRQIFLFICFHFWLVMNDRITPIPDPFIRVKKMKTRPKNAWRLKENLSFYILTFFWPQKKTWRLKSWNLGNQIFPLPSAAPERRIKSKVPKCSKNTWLKHIKWAALRLQLSIRTLLPSTGCPVTDRGTLSLIENLQFLAKKKFLTQIPTQNMTPFIILKIIFFRPILKSGISVGSR